MWECPEIGPNLVAKEPSGFHLKPGDQFPKHSAQRFLLGLAERQQEPLLVGDMAAERLVDRGARPGSVSTISLPRRSLGSGRRATSPARSSRSSRSVSRPCPEQAIWTTEIVRRTALVKIGVGGKRTTFAPDFCTG
jgi:hypothetical protein